jgi:hypothetical protein
MISREQPAKKIHINWGNSKLQVQEQTALSPSVHDVQPVLSKQATLPQGG